VPDPRFGPHGYAPDGNPKLKNYQVALTRQSQDHNFRLAQNGNSQGGRRHPPLKRVQTINAVDRGFATEARTPWGEVFDIIPSSERLFEHHPGGVNGPHSALHLPPTIDGCIQSLLSKDGGAAVDYAVVALSYLDETTGVTIQTKRYAPLATYRERDGTVVAITYFDPSTAYSVRIDPARIPLTEDNLAVTLKRADEQEMKKFWRFQSLLLIDQRKAFPLVADAVNLANAPRPVQERFKVVFEHAEKMLQDAIDAMEDETLKPAVMQMAAKLFGMPPDTPDETLYALLNTIWEHLTKMRESLPYLKEQSPYVIGFFKGAQGQDAGAVRANAFNQLMDMEMSFVDSNKSIVTFDVDYLMDPLNPLIHHAATLLHETGHVFFGWLDKMNSNAAHPLYAPLDGETVDLSPLTEAATQPGADPANHAPTLEHFLVMAAALRNEGASQSVMSYIHSPDVHTYTRSMTGDDFSAMIGMLGDIVERSPRAAPMRSVHLR
jgi:hypothetical protein